MEIKQGDKVRVSKDAPRIYFNRSVCSYPEYVFEVREVEDGNADIYYGAGKIPLAAYIIPIKYLIKVDAEAKEAKFKVGDRVCVKGCGYEPNLHKGDIGEILDTNDKEQCFVLFKKSQAWIYADCLELYTEPTAPKIKVGDKVRHMKVGQTWKVTAINGDLFTLKSDFGHENVCFGAELELVSPTEQTEAEKTKTKGNTLTFPIVFDLTKELEGCDSFVSIKEKIRKACADSFDWDAYTADLAKEVTVKSMEKSYGCDPERIAEYAVKVVKAVVEGLKRK